MLRIKNKLGLNKEKIDVNIVQMVYRHSYADVLFVRTNYVKRDATHIFEQQEYRMPIAIKNIGKCFLTGMEMTGDEKLLENYVIYCYDNEVAIKAAKQLLIKNITSKLERVEELRAKIKANIKQLKSDK